MIRCSTRHENRTRIPIKVVAIPVRKHPIVKEPGEDLLEYSNCCSDGIIPALSKAALRWSAQHPPVADEEGTRCWDERPEDGY